MTDKYTAQDVFDAIATGQVTDVDDMVADILAQKAATAIDAVRGDIRASMFGGDNEANDEPDLPGEEEDE